MKKELLLALDAALQEHTRVPDVLKPTGWPRGARSTQDTGTSFHRVRPLNVMRVMWGYRKMAASSGIKSATAAFTVVDGAFGGVDVGGRLGGAKIFWGTPRGSISTGEHPR